MPRSRSFHRAFCCAVLFLLCSVVSGFVSAEQPLNPAQEIKLQLEVLVNGRSKGVIVPFTVQANGQLTSADAFRPMVVRSKDGAPARLGELGEVVDGVDR